MATTSPRHEASVKVRITAGFVITLLMMLTLTVVGILRVHNIEASLDTIVDVNSVKERYAVIFRNTVYERALRLRDMCLATDMPQAEAARNTIAGLGQRYEKAWKDLQGVLDEQRKITPTELHMLDEIKAAEQRSLPAIERVIALRLRGDTDAARVAVLADARPQLLDWLAKINQFTEYQEQSTRAESDLALKTAHGFQWMMIGTLLAAAIVSLLAAAYVVRKISRALGAEPAEVKEIANHIASGDLSVTIDARTCDNSSVLAAMRTMRKNLARIICEVHASSEAIAANSRQIAAGNQDLSSRTEQQAASLENTASSMEQLTATVRQNADNARTANQLALSASKVATRGGDEVAHVVKRMTSINESAHKIVDIIGVIDGLAFQTNILALNAAVEAARAGEQGRGFAVVATEVRQLAQRSAAAAGEIKRLIDESVENVELGSKLVTEAGVTMADIVASVDRVTNIMSEIMTASQEQSQGIEQINEAISQMDQVTQSNAALVSQAASAAVALEERATRLEETVAIFQLEAGDDTRGASSSRIIDARIIPQTGGHFALVR